MSFVELTVEAPFKLMACFQTCSGNKWLLSGAADSTRIKGLKTVPSDRQSYVYSTLLLYFWDNKATRQPKIFKIKNKMQMHICNAKKATDYMCSQMVSLSFCVQHKKYIMYFLAKQVKVINSYWFSKFDRSIMLLQCKFLFQSISLCR